MSRLHSTLIALLLGAAAVSGAYAATRTVRLGATAATTQVATAPARELAARRAKLLRWSRSLARERAKRPPALPRVPHLPPVQVPVSAPVVAPAVAPSAVTYAQAPPVVRYKRAASPPPTTTTGSSSLGDDGSGQSDDGGGDDGGGGGD